MARFREPTKKQRKEWDAWVASRPEVVRKVAERLVPWELYRMKSTGHNAVVIAFAEDGTVQVAILGRFNPKLLMERRVFGISPDDLEPTEVPEEPGEVILSQEEAEEHIDELKVMVRPDLFAMGPDGKAIRKN